MSAIEELRRAKAAEEQEKDRAKAEKMEREKDECVQRFVALFGQALMDELGAQPGHTGLYPFMTLTYRGSANRWTVGMSRSDMYAATPSSLSEWMDDVDKELAKWAEKRKVARGRVVGMESVGHRLNLEMDAVELYALREFDDVREALERYEARCKAEAEQKKRERRAAIKAELKDYVQAIENARSAETREELREINEWRERRQYSEYPRHVYIVAKCLDAALADGWARMRRADEECEAKRMQAEAEAFRPFVFYRAHYGVVALEDGEAFVETRSIDALHRPLPVNAGWPLQVLWYPVSDDPVELEHLVKVEHVAVLSVDELPGWCPSLETECGMIMVAPEGAEFIAR